MASPERLFSSQHEGYIANPTESEKVFNGLRIGKDIYIASCSPLNFMLRYFHENGHILGDKLSFKSGDVLTPVEAKQTCLSLPQFEVSRLLQQLTSPHFSSDELDQRTLYIANEILQAFTKGAFDESQIKLHYGVSSEEIERLLRGADKTPGVTVTDEGHLTSESSKEGRNSELSSIATEYGCMKILENTVNTHPLMRTKISITPGGGSHLRAFKIVERAYRVDTMVLPSTLDLGTTYS